MKILMSGPIRPSEDAVLEVIQSLRRQFVECVIFLSTWKSHTTSRIRNAVDYYDEINEPSNEHISDIVVERTYQQQQLGLSDETPGCKYSLYKMIRGVENVCKLASLHVADSDIVMRIRTDSMFLFEPNYIETLPTDSYIARNGMGFDWFCITTFANLKSVWCFSTPEEYNKCVKESWNPEDMIFRRVKIPIVYLNKSLCESYIIREGGFKHYY